MQHVIIGSGPAGVIAAETLRKEDRDCDIVLIGDEPGPPYSRMAIPYYLTGNIEETGMHLRKTEGHFDRLGIRLLHARAEKVSPGAKSVALDNGEKLSYDRLLIASGAHPTKPPIKGLDLPRVHHCWTMEDARNIVELCKPGTEVLIMGAGFVACIIIPALVKRGAKVTVVVRSRMVRSMMNETASGLIRRWCESKGVRVLTRTKVSLVDDGSGALNVTLDSGERINPKLIVVAMGVNPNTAFLEGSGVETDDGVVVDEFLRTNDPDIYAAGDVAQGPDISTGGRSVHAIQPTACEHGRIAALNMAGKAAAYKGSLSMNVLDTMGLLSVSFGKWGGVDGGDSAEALDEDKYRYLHLEFEDDRLVGACGIGVTQHIGIIRGLIQTRLPLGGWKQKLMEDPHRVIEAYVARIQA